VASEQARALITTTITFHGDYESAESERTLRGRLRMAVTRGHNRDHRPIEDGGDADQGHRKRVRKAVARVTKIHRKSLKKLAE